MNGNIFAIGLSPGRKFYWQNHSQFLLICLPSGSYMGGFIIAIFSARNIPPASFREVCIQSPRPTLTRPFAMTGSNARPLRGRTCWATEGVELHRWVRGEV